MTKRPHHMILYSRDADSQLFMNLAIAQSIDAAPQKNAAGLLGHGSNGLLIFFQRVSHVQTMFLFGSAHGLPFFLKGAQHDIVALALSCAIDKQIFREAAQASSGVPGDVPLAGSRRPP